MSSRVVQELDLFESSMNGAKKGYNLGSQILEKLGCSDVSNGSYLTSVKQRLKGVGYKSKII